MAQLQKNRSHRNTGSHSLRWTIQLILWWEYPYRCTLHSIFADAVFRACSYARQAGAFKEINRNENTVKTIPEGVCRFSSEGVLSRTWFYHYSDSGILISEIRIRGYGLSM